MIYGLILNEKCFKFPIQPYCTFNWIFPYGPFTTAACNAIKVGAEHGALGELLKLAEVSHCCCQKIYARHWCEEQELIWSGLLWLKEACWHPWYRGDKSRTWNIYKKNSVSHEQYSTTSACWDLTNINGKRKPKEKPERSRYFRLNTHESKHKWVPYLVRILQLQLQKLQQIRDYPRKMTALVRAKVTYACAHEETVERCRFSWFFSVWSSGWLLYRATRSAQAGGLNREMSGCPFPPLALFTAALTPSWWSWLYPWKRMTSVTNINYNLCLCVCVYF